MIRIVHTADVHLGGSRESGERSAFGSRTRQHQDMKCKAFERCVDLAIERQTNALVVAGDLFDSLRPPQRRVDFVRSQLRKLCEALPAAHVFVLPGTHDCVAQGGLWHSPGLDAGLSSVHCLVDPGGECVVVEDLGLAVHGRPQSCDDDRHEPLRGLAPVSGMTNVALAHGSVAIPEKTDSDGSLITPEALAGCGMDYVALGHWHSPYGALTGPVTAWYSGSPEVLALGQAGAGHALVVELDGAGPARVGQVKTGALSVRHETIDVADLSGEQEIEDRLTALADANLVLDVVLTGIASPGLALDIEQVLERLEGSFFRLRIRDRFEIAVDEDGLPREQIAGRFASLMREKLQQAQGDERAERVAERALQLGVALLAGKDVLA